MPRKKDTKAKKQQSNQNYILQYYQEIKNGKIIVGKWIIMVMEYIVHGLEEGLFCFDGQKANNAVDWIESHCFHTEGPLAPGLLILNLWQKAIISCIFGIVDQNGLRQFREIVVVVSRKQGKSLLMAAIAKYTWYLDGGFGTRIFCLAPKLEQSDLIYSSIWNMVLLDPEYQEMMEAKQSSKDQHNRYQYDDSQIPKKRQSDLMIPATNSTVKKIAFSAKKSDGFNPSLTICDEIASWEGDRGLKQYEVMKSGMGARPEGLLISCSTSGYVNDSIYDELIKRSTRMLMGESKEKRLAPFLYMIDDPDKWNDINELHKSNPNLGVSVTVDYLLEEIAIAEGSLSKKAEFMTKYCNIKQNSSLAWLTSKDVEGSYDSRGIDLETFRGCYAVCGLDLSQTTDLTSACVVIEKDDHLYCFSHFWLPAERIEEASERDGLPYNIYIQRGILSPSGENFIDYHDCYNWFKGLIEQYEIYPLRLGYDRYSAKYLISDLESYGYHCDDVFQGENLYPVLTEFEGLLKDGRIHIGDNDLLKVHMLNSALKMSVERGRGKLVKIRPSDHIDGMAALADAFTVRQKWYPEIGEQLKNK